MANPNNLTDEQIKQGYSTIPGDFNPVTGVINNAQLKPAAPINNLGVITNTANGASAVEGANTVQADMQKYIDLANQPPSQEQTIADSLLKDLGLAGESLVGRGQDQLAAEAQVGIPTINKDLAATNAELLTATAEYKKASAEYEKLKSDIEAGAGRKGLTTGAVMGQQGAVTRAQASELNRKASDIALIQAKALGQQGQLEAAQKAADRAIDLKYQDLEDAYKVKKDQYNLNKDILDKYDKKRSDALAYALNKEEKALTEVKDYQKTILNNALSSGASQSVINGILNSKTREEITKAGAGYLQSKADKLDMQLKQAQIDNQYANLAKTNAERIALGKPGSGKPPTDTQITNAGYATRIAQANQVIDNNPKVFTDMNYAQFKLIESNSPLANKTLTPAQQQAAQAMRSFITAKLRKESGAAISPTEFADARSTYFPQYGDSQEVLAQKKATRDAVLQNNIQGAGSAYQVNTLDSYLNTVDKVSSSSQSKVTDYLSSLPKIGNK